jgi:hypothetical protein
VSGFKNEEDEEASSSLSDIDSAISLIMFFNKRAKYQKLALSLFFQSVLVWFTLLERETLNELYVVVV